MRGLVVPILILAVEEETEQKVSITAMAKQTSMGLKPVCERFVSLISHLVTEDEGTCLIY
jgi:hypothetical protein